MHLLVIGQNYGKMTSTNPSEVQVYKRINGWCDAMGIDYYSFLNVQAREGEYAPTPDDLVFLNFTVALHEGPIVVLGYKVWKTMHHVFGKRRAGAMLAPHPSGMNRNFNDPKFERLFLLVFKIYLERKDHALHRS